LKKQQTIAVGKGDKPFCRYRFKNVINVQQCDLSETLGDSRGYWRQAQHTKSIPRLFGERATLSNSHSLCTLFIIFPVLFMKTGIRRDVPTHLGLCGLNLVYQIQRVFGFKLIKSESTMTNKKLTRATELLFVSQNKFGHKIIKFTYL
jgi:hypothetical protein